MGCGEIYCLVFHLLLFSETRLALQASEQCASSNRSSIEVKIEVVMSVYLSLLLHFDICDVSMQCSHSGKQVSAKIINKICR